jgi:hypothetical protein
MTCEGAWSDWVDVLSEDWNVHRFHDSVEVCELRRHDDVYACFFACFLGFLSEFNGSFPR